MAETTLGDAIERLEASGYAVMKRATYDKIQRQGLAREQRAWQNGYDEGWDAAWAAGSAD